MCICPLILIVISIGLANCVESELIVLNDALAKFRFDFEGSQSVKSIDKFSLDIFDSFGTADKGLRTKRSPCPSGVGNFGFNSFNFLTFMVMVFNAVANTNNNINNNNNNDNDINLNSVSQDDNQVVSNSDNMNTIMAMILPVPGRRRRRSTAKKQQNCSSEQVAAELFDVAVKVSSQGSLDYGCVEYFICNSLLHFKQAFNLEDVLVPGGAPHDRLRDPDCDRLFPECRYRHGY
jgi:hypothetical protein